MLLPVRSLVAAVPALGLALLAACGPQERPAPGAGGPPVAPAQGMPAMASPAPAAAPQPASSAPPDPAPAPVPAGTAPAPAPRPPDARLVVDAFTYDPVVLRIPAGTRVIFAGADNVGHTVTDRAGRFDFVLLRGDVAEYTFDVPGVYEYYCEYHRSMQGTIIVE